MRIPKTEGRKTEIRLLLARKIRYLRTLNERQNDPARKPNSNAIRKGVVALFGCGRCLNLKTELNVV
jgi:hypothetical protein